MPKREFRTLKTLIWLPALTAMIVLFTNPTFSYASEDVYGIDVTVYDNYGYNSSPPLPDISGRPIAGTTTYFNIDQNFDSLNPFGLRDDFIVKYEGHITVPVSGEVIFWPQADDGTKFFLDGVLVDEGNWVDKGGGGYQTGPQIFTAGNSKPFTYWYYENGGGSWTTLYWDIGDGWEIVPASAFSKTPRTTTTTTTLAPYFNPVKNLNAAVDIDGGVNINWDTPEISNLDIYAYSISFYKLKDGEESGGWGVWTEGSTYNLGPWMWQNTTGYGEVRLKVRPGNVACFAPSDLQCFYGPDEYVDILIEDPTPPTTTTIPVVTTTTTTLPIILPQITVPVETTAPKESTTTTTNNQQTDTTTTQPEVKTPTTEPTFVQNTTSSSSSTTTSSTSTTIPTVNSTSSTSTTVPAVEETPKEQPKTELNTEKIVETLSNPEILNSISTKDATEIFESIDVKQMTQEQVDAIIDAVQSAPKEIRETFEDTVDLFGGGFDSYKMVDSEISVGERRTIIAVNLVTASVVAASAAGGLGSSGGAGGGNPGGGGGSSPNSGAKKNEEEEPEMAGEIAGDGLDWVSKISIYKIKGEERVLDWKAFIKKFTFGLLNLSFTIAGSVVVYFTLSGSIQKIALVSTLAALAASMYLHMKEPND